MKTNLNTAASLCPLFFVLFSYCVADNTALAQEPPYVVAHKITNPDPDSRDFFGVQVELVGDTIAITARDDDTFGPNAGAVYLFDLAGQHLRTLSSPNAQEDGKFGEYLVAVGDDKLLVAANREDDRAGRVYLFDLSGNLLRTFEAPNPTAGAEYGGRALLANQESLYISSWREPSDISDLSGAVFKYNHSGELLHTFANPRQNTIGCFGRSATFVGDRHILIGDVCDNSSGVEEAGAAFIFDLDGNLVQSFDNPAPTPLDQFGASVAFANNRILIGGTQIDDLESGASTGAAYIFELDGTLVTRVSDPEPNPGNWFGWNASQTEHGTFIIGSVFNSTPSTRAGKVYLVNEFGTVTQALSSPEPGGQQFGVNFEQSDGLLLIGETWFGPEQTGAVWIFTPADPGDYNGSGNIDIEDLNQLCTAIGRGGGQRTLDITGDAVTDDADVTLLLESAGSGLGDANLDGRVDFDDFDILQTNFGASPRATWSQGDFDCNRHVNFDDFVLLSKNFGHSFSNAANAPEGAPSFTVLLILVGLWRAYHGQPRT